MINASGNSKLPRIDTTRSTTKKTDSSGGLTIPAELLDEARLGEEVKLIVKDGLFVLRAASHAPRQGWFDGYEEETDTDS